MRRPSTFASAFGIAASRVAWLVGRVQWLQPGRHRVLMHAAYLAAAAVKAGIGAGHGGAAGWACSRAAHWLLGRNASTRGMR